MAITLYGCVLVSRLVPSRVRLNYSKIITDYAAGDSIEVVARKNKCSDGAVSAIIRKEAPGLLRRPRHGKRAGRGAR